jgi:PAS domain S-box-containing protein
VITFSDVAAEALQKARLYAESIVDTVREPLLVLDGDMRVRSVNQSFYSTFDVSPEETIGRLLYDLGDHQWDIPRFRTLLGDILPEEHVLKDFEIEHDFKSLGPRNMLLNARAIAHSRGRPDLILLAIEDVTERKRAEEALQQQTAELRARNAELDRFSCLVSGREMRVIELKQEVNQLADQLGQPHPYPLAFMDAAAEEVLQNSPRPAEQESEIQGRGRTSED